MITFLTALLVFGMMFLFAFFVRVLITPGTGE